MMQIYPKGLIAFAAFLAVTGIGDFHLPTALADRVIVDPGRRTRGSTNHGGMLDNDDGSVSVLAPKFNAPNGQNLPLMATGSSLDGICLLYGLGSYVTNSAVSHDDSNSLGVKISASGRFAGYLDNRTTEGFVLDSLACSLDRTIPQSRRAHMVRNDDGSVSLVSPAFLMNGNAMRLMAEGASLDGICHLFGFESYIDQSLVGHDDSNSVGVVIGPDGRFNHYLDNRTQVGTLIDSMACSSESRIPASHRANLIRNDDGSVSVVDPLFRVNGREMRIMSTRSDLNGICRLFGFDEYLDGSLDAFDDSATVGVLINASGQFAGYLDSRTNVGLYVKSLMCL